MYQEIMNNKHHIIKPLIVTFSFILSTHLYAQGKVEVNDDKTSKTLNDIKTDSKSKQGNIIKYQAFKTDVEKILKSLYVEKGTAPTLGSESAKKYLGDVPCQGEGPIYENCVAVRNTKAAMIAELENILKQLDSRIKIVQLLITKSNQKGLTAGELQGLQTQISSYQTLINTDAMRASTTMQIYRERLDLYAQQRTEYLNKVLYGPGKTKGITGAASFDPNLWK